MSNLHSFSYVGGILGNCIVWQKDLDKIKLGSYIENVEQMIPKRMSILNT